MSPQRKTALVSVGAAAALVALKLGVGLAAHSLGLLSEAAHSGTDLVAALLTFFAVGVAARPADPSHQYGHGKAEHLGALGEASFLVLVSIAIGYRAISHLVGSSQSTVDPAWYAIATVVLVMADRPVACRRLESRGAALPQRRPRRERDPFRERPARLGRGARRAAAGAGRASGRRLGGRRSSSRCSCCWRLSG